MATTLCDVVLGGVREPTHKLTRAIDCAEDMLQALGVDTVRSDTLSRRVAKGLGDPVWDMCVTEDDVGGYLISRGYAAEAVAHAAAAWPRQTVRSMRSLLAAGELGPNDSRAVAIWRSLLDGLANAGHDRLRHEVERALCEAVGAEQSLRRQYVPGLILGILAMYGAMGSWSSALRTIDWYKARVRRKYVCRLLRGD